MEILFAKNTIKDFTGLETEKSSFCFYYGDKGAEKAGYFVPRELRGYIRDCQHESEKIRRAAHEVAHGVYLENAPSGYQIIQMDREIAEMENAIFGKILGKEENLTVTENDGVLSNNYLKIIENNPIKKSRKFVRKKDFENYWKARNSYSELVSADIEDQEGFCSFLEYKIVETFDPVFAAKLLSFYLHADDAYGRGFRKLSENPAGAAEYVMRRR